MGVIKVRSGKHYKTCEDFVIFIYEDKLCDKILDVREFSKANLKELLIDIICSL